MLSFRRLAVTTTAVASLAVPTAAQADRTSAGLQQPTIDKVSPDARYGVPNSRPRDRQGLPRRALRRAGRDHAALHLRPQTEVVEADNGFAWDDALIGGGAALAAGPADRRHRRGPCARATRPAA